MHFLHNKDTLAKTGPSAGFVDWFKGKGGIVADIAERIQFIR
jgi:hypothetical protein